MRFALDATPLTLSSGGLPRYVSELSWALAREFPSDDFLLLSDQAFPFSNARPNLRRGAGPRNWLERRWWLWGAERACARERVDVFHGTNFAVPYFARRAAVLSILDLSPWMNPEWHAGADRVRRHTPRMIRFATMILTLSEAVRKQVIDRFRVAPDRVVAVPLAASSHFRPSPAAAEPYFLFVGTLEPRKNIPLMLEAWREIRREFPIELILAGRRRSDFPEIPAEPGLLILGEVEEARLPGLYSNAVAVLYPSLYEGFGLPVLEAMQCGACAIASKDPAISEVAHGAAMQVDSAAEMAEAMRALLGDTGLQASYREKALARARDYSWAATARSTHAVYLEAIARFGR